MSSTTQAFTCSYYSNNTGRPIISGLSQNVNYAHYINNSTFIFYDHFINISKVFGGYFIFTIF